jgi:hypothetical protein
MMHGNMNVSCWENLLSCIVNEDFRTASSVVCRKIYKAAECRTLHNALVMCVMMFIIALMLSYI